MPQPHFSYIDFYEAVELIAHGLVDFDETYPHVTQIVRDWEEKWRSCTFFECVKVVDSALVVSLEENHYRIVISTQRLDLLSAVALLVNLKMPKSIKCVREILNNLFRQTDIVITN